MLPTSQLTINQTVSVKKTWSEKGDKHELTATIRYDNKCGNGHNTFSITGDLRVNGRWDSGGCLHEIISKKFPNYRHLIKWHLVSSDGPLHYIANTLYHVSERDHWGLLKGERKQIRSGKTGKLCWKMAILDKNNKEVPFEEKYKADHIDSETKPKCQYYLDYIPWERVGEGKKRDLDAARSCAVWPEATDEELLSPDLEEKLKARLPQLMEAFKRDIEALGFTY